MLPWITRRRRQRDAATALYAAIVSQARHPAFYRELGVADSVAGRFEMIVLHLFLVLERLGLEEDRDNGLARRLIEVFITAMDDEMREMGVGDQTVPKKIRRAADAMNGRFQAYSRGLRQDDFSALEAALRRNIFGGDGVPEVEASGILADYVSRSVYRLAECEYESLIAGAVPFADIGTDAGTYVRRTGSDDHAAGAGDA